MTALVVEFLPWLVGVGLALAAIFGIYRKGGDAREAKLKAKEAKDREKVIDRLADAAAAKPAGSMSDDPHNRDTWGS